MDLTRLVPLAVSAAIAAAGCTRHVYVPVEQVRVDTVRSASVVRELVAVADSVSVDRGADTVVVEHRRTVWRDRIVTDTLREVKVDTLTKVVAPPSGSATGNSGRRLALVCMALGCIAVYFMLIRRR